MPVSLGAVEISSLVGNAEAFPVLRHWDFFNHAGTAAISGTAGEAIRTFAAQAESVAYIDTGWYRDIEKLRQSAAHLINAHRDEIAFVKNTSEGLATVAHSIDWRAGDRVVTAAVEFPANMYPWMELARRFGVELVRVAERERGDGTREVPVEEVLREAAHPRVRLVSLSHVQYASGQRMDLASVGKWCRENGRLFCVDAIQSVGVLPVDVRALHADFLAGDGHKWMLGPEGAGILYCRRELLAQTRPLLVGWMNVINATDYANHDYTLKSDAGKFECGSYNVAGLLGLRGSIDMLLGVGMDKVAGRVRALTERFIAGVREKGYVVASPRGEGEWSGIVSFASAKKDHTQVWRTLRKDHRVELALREGRLRFSPHFYNTEAQVDRLVGLL